MTLPPARRSQRIAALQSGCLPAASSVSQPLQHCHLSTALLQPTAAGANPKGVRAASTGRTVPGPATCQAATGSDHSQGPQKRRARGLSTKKDEATPGPKGGSGGEVVEGEEGEEAVDSKKRRNKRVYPTREREARLWQMGYRHVAGVDEAGRGPLAGPVVAAACVIPRDVHIPGIDDSKKLKEEERERLYGIITSTPGVVFSTCVVPAETVDRINILQATMEAMGMCVQKLCRGEGEGGSGEGASGGHTVVPDFVLIDGNRVPKNIPEVEAEGVVRGDSEHFVIAAASILAKVTRDRLMTEYDKKWPHYGFKQHKGYGTEKHIAALLSHGPCDIHRRSFAPLKDWNLLKGSSLGGEA